VRAQSSLQVSAKEKVLFPLEGLVGALSVFTLHDAALAETSITFVVVKVGTATLSEFVPPVREFIADASPSELQGHAGTCLCLFALLVFNSPSHGVLVLPPFLPVIAKNACGVELLVSLASGTGLTETLGIDRDSSASCDCNLNALCFATASDFHRSEGTHGD
jgi:hypothetical protein